MAKNSSTVKAQTHRFDAEVGKVLKLMIHSLYTNKDIFLRELISNASDACDKLRYEALTAPELLEGAGVEFKITLSSDAKARTVTISDNGIGMGHDELVANLGTIAKSGTQEFAAQMTDQAASDASLIGQFGVGFYSSFMVADKVVVESTRAGSAETWRWTSEGVGEFTVESVEVAPRGTTVTLHLKKGEDSYLDKFRLRHIVQTYSDHISFPIEFIDEGGKSGIINTASALWTRPKSEVKDEQYKEFYHHVAHLPDEPWLTLHNRAEGKLEYISLLFVPSIQPFDLFHPDRKRRVKLYVKRVFITDENVDVVPHYLRFLRGVVDSEDLPLNISRETLQHNPTLVRIRDSVVKKVLSELKKKAEKDVEGYAKFWKNFGAVLKEGLCEGASPREQILEASRFASTQASGLTGLDDYIGRMKPEQKHIFYLTGEREESLRVSPQLEGFAKRGIEVLLFTDHVDDFWVNVVADYKGTQFKSITRADIDLDALGASADDVTPDQPEEKLEANASVIERLKAILGDRVKDVRFTKKLTDSPVCLAVEEGAMDIRLERFLREQKQLATVSAKILELNPDHPIICRLAEKILNPAADAEVEDIAWLLFDQARILEGEEISDPAAFTRRLSRFLEKSLAA